MAEQKRPELPIRRRPPSFTPRFTISIFYLAIFFVLASFAQVLPDLIDLLGQPLTPEEQEARASAIMREGLSPYVSLGISLLVTSLGAYLQVLPGMREG